MFFVNDSTDYTFDSTHRGFGPLSLFLKRLLNDTVIEPEHMLGGAVAKALRQQWSMDAAGAPARKDRPSILRGAFERVEEASKEPGGLKRFFYDHIPRLIMSFQVGVNLNDFILILEFSKYGLIMPVEKTKTRPSFAGQMLETGTR